MYHSVEHPAAPVGIVSTNVHGRITGANGYALDRLFGTAANRLIGRAFSELLSPASQMFFKLQLSQLLALNHSFSEVALQVARADGTTVDVLANALRRDEETVYALFPAPARKLRDKELKEARAAAETKNRLLSQIERLASIGAWTLDDDLRTLSLSDEIFHICELPVGRAPELAALLALFVERDEALLTEHLRQTLRSGSPLSYEGEFKTFAGSRRRVRATAEVEKLPGKRKRLVGILQDVTRNFETERQLQQLAHFDPLTGLANRAQFQVKLDELISLAKCGVQSSLLLLDLDGFKEINDTFGHDAGDDLLVQMGKRIRAAAGDLFCARLGGDEFAVFHSADAHMSLDDLADSLLSALHRPVSVAGITRSVSASVGIKSFVGDGITASRVYKRADLALYQAKSQGRDRSVRFEPRFEASIERRHRHVLLIQEAARLGQIRPYFQPILTAGDRRVVGFEALARIVKNDDEVLSPAQFHEALSDPLCSLLIHNAVLEGVLAALQSWSRQLRDDIRISFNLAEAVLRSPGFPLSFLNELARREVPPAQVTIEIQETVFLGRDAALIRSKLQAVRDAGCRIALDDFGTGFASLSHLVDFPVDCIKIDQSFVSDLEERPDKQAVVRAIIGLGKNLSLSVIAEGVETVEQAEYLSAHGCGYLQGYFFNRAVSQALAADMIFGETARASASG
jgi:diguanylate cyclase (GGDEF)-like protein/PAS domain S-box-containing protein